MKFYTSTGFYLSLITAVLSIAAAIIYGAGFQKETLTEYFSAMVVVLPIIGVVMYIVFAAFEKTAPLAPVALWAFEFAGLLTFISTAYMYLSGIFYNGVSMEAMAAIDPAYLMTVVFLLVACIVGNVSLWFGQTGKRREKNGGTYEKNL